MSASEEEILCHDHSNKTSPAILEMSSVFTLISLRMNEVNSSSMCDTPLDSEAFVETLGASCHNTWN